MEVVWLARRIADREDRCRTFRGSDPGPRGLVVDRNRVVGPKGRGVGLHHRVEFQTTAHVGEDRHAELPAAVGDHKVDRRGRDFLRGADKIAFVLTVFGVDDNDNFAATNRFDGFFDSGKTTQGSRYSS